ncbi:uncharacterized protein [Rutidosis leptorrhynchoides]|uniref:uncharacterized protein n=1 Tax=Rutidosis leptorrhynchoides TaxID=125765 RepID=UPI003A996272
MTEDDLYMIHSWATGQRRKARALDEWKHEPIIFPSLFNINPSRELVIIKAHISNCQIGRIYTDTDAGVEVMFEHCFWQLPEGFHIFKRFAASPLAGFNSAITWPVGSITLEVVLGKIHFQNNAEIEFSIVKTESRYNVILGRTAMQNFRAVTSTVHGILKFATPVGIATIQTQELKLVECLQIFKDNADIIIHVDGSISPNPKHSNKEFSSELI